MEDVDVLPFTNLLTEKLNLFSLKIDQVVVAKWWMNSERIKGTAWNKSSSTLGNVHACASESINVNVMELWRVLRSQNTRISGRVFPHNCKFDLRPHSDFIELQSRRHEWISFVN
jgi:hypothetical protein